MNRLMTRTFLFLAILTLTYPALPLLGQQTQTPPAPKTSEQKAEEEKKPKVNEEMVVTARKREETVQEVPMSVAQSSGTSGWPSCQRTPDRKCHVTRIWPFASATQSPSSIVGTLVASRGCSVP